MQNLVDKIAQERKHHIDTIENLTLNQIKQIVSPLSSTRPLLIRAGAKESETEPEPTKKTRMEARLLRISY